MNNKLSQNIFIIIITVIVSFFFFIVLLLLSTRSASIPIPDNASRENNNFIELNLNNSNIYTFDKKYLDYDNYKSLFRLSKDINLCNLIFQNEIECNNTFINLLTDTLKELHFNSDSIIALEKIAQHLQWVNGFKYYSKMFPENNTIQLSVYDYWMNNIANYLTIYSQKHKSAKLNNLFSYLVNQCEENSYNVSVKVTSIDKVIYNFTHNYFGHLINASWVQSSLYLKLILVLVFLITIFCYSYSFFKLLEKLK